MAWILDYINKINFTYFECDKEEAMMWTDMFILKGCLPKCLGKRHLVCKLLSNSPADTYRPQ